MRLSGHVIGLLKGYMRDLVEQARQEEDTHRSFGFSTTACGPDEAISDFLAILDDRIESEGVEVGLTETFLHHMWMLCDEAQTEVKERVWLELNMSGQVIKKAAVRELTYRALIDYLDRQTQ